MKKICTFLLLVTVSLAAKAQRNVILIIADDLGTDYLGFYEDHQDTAPVPNIRKLLAKGVRFTNAWSNPVCSATRAGILTGQYSFRTGVGGIVGGIGGSGALNINELTIPRLLNTYKPNGIAKANIGKWHLHNAMPVSNLNNPNVMGYDHFAGNFIGQLTSYTNWTKVTNGVSSTVTNYATTETANDAINWIKAQNSKPFFLWLAFNAPHAPYHLPPAGLHSYTNLSGTQQDIMMNPKSYFKASLEALDHEIGRLFDSLQVHNQLENTDIIFIGDNGNTIQTAQIANTARAKGTIYQYGVHVPFMISGPSVVNPGRVSDALVNTTDLFATILELFGYADWPAQIPANKPVDSKSILPILKNQATIVRPWAFTEGFKTTPDAADGKTMRNMEYKLLHFDDGRAEFYHVASDPVEANNLIPGNLNASQATNYLYLCNEMSTLVGTGSFCDPAIKPPLISTISVAPVSCFGEASGAISLSVNGGTPPYSYHWENGAIAPNRTGLIAGSYTVTITDIAGQTTVQMAVITQAQAALTPSMTVVAVKCFGDSTGQINCSVTGGTSGYSFIWEDGNTEQNRSSLPAGIYAVTVSDANHCTATETGNIGQPSQITATSGTIPATCGEENGAISLSVLGGLPPYTFLWNNGNTNQNLSNLSSGAFTVLIVDANACNNQFTASIPHLDGPIASAISTAVSCFGEATGTIHVSISNGMAPFMFLWNDGSTEQNRSTVPAGIYTLTVTDANQCTTSLLSFITQSIALETTASTSPDVCKRSNGTISLTVSGGNMPYVYQWNNGLNSTNLTNLSAGDYRVYVTDSLGCVIDSTFNIGAIEAPILDAITNHVNCFSDANGSIDLLPMGGTPPYFYAWSNGLTSQQISGLSANVYSIVLSDANGCSVTADYTILQPSEHLAITIDVTNSTGSNDGTASTIVAGGTPPYTYVWNNGITGSQLINLSPGNYTVTLSDANHCTTTAIATVELTISTENVPDDVRLQISPNPGTDRILVQTRAILKNALQLTLVNAAGQMISAHLLNPGDMQCAFDTAGLSTGIYFLKVRDGIHQEYFKVIIAR